MKTEEEFEEERMINLALDNAFADLEMEEFEKNKKRLKNEKTK